MPVEFKSNVPETTIEDVRSPSFVSDAVAPGSLKLPPTSTETFESPINWIVGFVESTTCTVLFKNVVFPSLSVTLYCIW